MRKVWLLALNDLRLTVRDRTAFIWMIVFPIAFIWFFGRVGEGGGDPPRISLAVVDQDGGWLAEALVRELRVDAIRLRELTPEERSGDEELVRTLVIPAGFTDGIASGEPQVVRLELEAESNAEFGQGAQAHIQRAVARLLAGIVELGGTEAELDPDALAALRERPARITLRVEAAGEGRPVPSGLAQSVPGILTMVVLMMTLIYGGVFLAVERRQGMLRRQAGLPLSRRQIFWGKLVGRLVVAGAQILILLAVGRFAFGLDWGRSPAGLALVLASYAFAVAGLATLLGAVVRTAEQASSIGWIASMVMSALGGCWWPSEFMPRWLWNAAHLLPTAWAMDAFHALVSFGQGVEAVLLPSVVLLGFGGASAALGARFLRHF